jgi:thiopeptide-type bacteriocin biosynthesis protein
MQAEREWIGGHIHFVGDIYSGVADDVIRSIVEPFVRDQQSCGSIDSFFFIRYREDGPHVRLRLQGDPVILECRVAPALIAYIDGADKTRALDKKPKINLRWVSYQPELERYGGPAAVSVAEHFFEISSEAAFDLLRPLPTEPRSVRLGRALLAMLVLVQAFFPSEAQATHFLRAYADGYLIRQARDEHQHGVVREAFADGFRRQADTILAYVQESWLRLRADQMVVPALEPYRVGVSVIREKLRVLQAHAQLFRKNLPVAEWSDACHLIVPSYVHMMSNRLGVTIPEEAYLAYLATNALSQTADLCPSGR